MAVRIAAYVSGAALAGTASCLVNALSASGQGVMSGIWPDVQGATDRLRCGGGDTEGLGL